MKPLILTITVYQCNYSKYVYHVLTSLTKSCITPSTYNTYLFISYYYIYSITILNNTVLIQISTLGMSHPRFLCLCEHLLCD